jgi:hypothetical protein
MAMRELKYYINAERGKGSKYVPFNGHSLFLSYVSGVLAAGRGNEEGVRSKTRRAVGMSRHVFICMDNFISLGTKSLGAEAR